jgi:hypothetical protein
LKRSWPRNSNGIGLVELMVSSALMILLTYGAYQVFINGLRLAKDSEAKLTMQKNLITSIGLLSREISESNPSSVRYDRIPEGVVFASPRSATGALALAGSGDMSWEKVIAYYVSKEKRLVRKEWMLDPYVRQSGFAPSLGAGFSTANLRDEPLPARVVARGLELFEVQFSGNIANIEVSASQTDSRGRKHVVRLETAVRINN